MKTKQVIVIRKDLKCRRGKEVSQGSHSSIAFLTRQLQEQLSQGKDTFSVRLTEAQKLWIQGSFAKICVQVDSEEELLAVHAKAQEAGLESHLVQDSGLTEFSGPTYTAVAIGPDYSERIDVVTGHLKLY